MSTDSLQSFEQHRRYVVGYHIVTSTLVFAYLTYGILKVATEFSVESVFTIVAGVAIGLVGYYAREFALGNQDRIIRLEERLRLATLLPEELRKQADALKSEQLIALRFASDDELPELTRKVLADGISDREEIKKLIRRWRPDNHRI